MEVLVGALSREFEARSYAQGEFLAKEGQWHDTIFYIESGSCDVHQNARLPPDEDFANEEVWLPLLVLRSWVQVRWNVTPASSDKVVSLALPQESFFTREKAAKSERL
jgi:hypothetical protein